MAQMGVGDISTLSNSFQARSMEAILKIINVPSFLTYILFGTDQRQHSIYLAKTILPACNEKPCSLPQPALPVAKEKWF